MNDHPTDPSNEAEPGSLRQKAFWGAAIMVATRFSVRFLGLISAAFLARLLTPEDFGLFATASLALSFFLLIKDVGMGEAVIKQKNLTKQDLDTLWTIRFLLSFLSAGALLIVAPFIAVFLKDPRVLAVLQIMALVPIIDSFASPASALMLRDFKFGSDFVLKSSDKLVRVIVVIGVALILKSYWALVFGALLASVFGVIISHIARPYRPNFTLVNYRDHIDFALWTYLRNVANYVARSSDEFIVRGMTSTEFFGIYHMSRDLARTLIGELIAPVGEAMLPALSKMQQDPARLATAISNVFGAALIVGTAVSFGVAVTAPELVLVILGDQWTTAAPFLTMLAVGAACNSVGEINRSSFIAAGLAKSSTNFWLLRALIYSIGCLIAGLYAGPTEIALTFTALSVCMLFVEARHLFIVMGLEARILSLAVRPLTSGFAMVAAVYFLPLPDTLPLILVLLSKVAVGATAFGVAAVLLWKISGYKEGPELTIYASLPLKLKAALPIQPLKNQ